MKTAREVIKYCYSHNHIINYDRFAIAIKDLNKLETVNADLLAAMKKITKHAYKGIVMTIAFEAIASAEKS